jgi:uncharacterized protein (UPF0548 family)
MITVRRPTLETIKSFLEVQSGLAFTYPSIGSTTSGMPSGYTVDHTRVQLGQGKESFEAARSAIDGWKQFALGWLEAVPADTPIRVNATVGILVRATGLWWLNSARIVYVVDETSAEVSRYGFAYGTLPGHVEAGEERFLVEWHHGDDSVWYDILAFSRPRHFLSRIGKSQVRRMQKRFSRDSAAAMQRAVQSAS